MKTLVLTPHQLLMPESGEILFSGAWCLNRETRDWVSQRRLTYSVADYPWDKPGQHYLSYLYAAPLYESFLELLADRLNSIHHEHNDVDYWRIVAGPAVYTVLWHLLDRWNIANTLVKRGDFDSVPVIEFEEFAFTPAITADVNPDSHCYNHYLLSAAMREIGDNSKISAIKLTAPPRPEATFRESDGTGLRSNLRSATTLVMRKLRRVQNQNVFILDSCLPRLRAAMLNVSLGRLPFQGGTTKIRMPAPSRQLRDSLDLTLSAADGFSVFAAKMLRSLLPVYLLEGYAVLQGCWERENWPRAPKAIFTSNAFQYNEVFQHYAATKIASHGTKLVVGQHGGVSGILKWCFGEDHQIRIADSFLSWGWKSQDKRVIPAFVLTILGRHLKPAGKSGDLLLTTAPIRRYSHKGIAWPVGPQQSEAFLAHQLAFARGLDKPVAGHLLVRIFKSLDERLETEYVQRWRQTFPDIRIDDSTESIFTALKKARLFVYTYNSTGYLETLSMNFPTVMFWDPGLFEGKPLFNEKLAELERVGIFHRTPEAAARHVNSVWNDLESWWHSTDVQNCRSRFVEVFASQAPANWLGFLKTHLAGG